MKRLRFFFQKNHQMQLLVSSGGANVVEDHASSTFSAILKFFVSFCLSSSYHCNCGLKLPEVINMEPLPKISLHYPANRF